MASVRVNCSCGHAWDYSGSAPLPTDVREICPVCAHPDAELEASTPIPPGAPRPTDTAFTLTPGKVIAGFEILEEINRGGMGVIYRAKQLGLDRIVALKVIAPNRLGNPEARKRFKQEVKTAGALNHSNIVTVYQTDIDGPVPYLAMEYVPGIDLARLVKQHGPLEPSDAIHYIHQAAQGLQHAHEQGLVHRDIKPANLMVTPNPFERPGGKSGKLPRLKILDMGLARLVSENEGEGELTRDGIFLGTPDYIAPEQAEDSRSVDIRADIYSLGASLFFLLTGQIPFVGNTIVQKLRRQITEPPPSVMALRPEVGAALDALVRRMMARNPAERIQTPAELIESLDRVSRGGSIPSAPTPGGRGSGAFQMLALGAQNTPATGIPSTAQVRAHSGGIHSIAVANEGHVLLTGGLDGAIKVWNAAKLKEVRTFSGNIGPVEQVAIAPGAKWAASCSVRLTVQEMGVQLWEVGAGTERRRLRGPGDNIRCVTISPDGMRVAAGSADQTIWVWSVEAGGPKTLRLTGHKAAVTGVAFVSGDSLLTAGQDGTVRQWDLDTLSEKGVLDAGVGSIAGMAYALKGKRLAVVGKTLALRNKGSARFSKLDGHDGPVTCVAFSPDGSLIATGGMDKSVRLWQTEEGTEIACYTGHQKPVWSVAFGADGGVLYTGGEDGTLRRWPVSIQVA